MFRKLAGIAGVAAVVAALLVPTAFGSGPNGNGNRNGAGTGSCAQAGTCVPKLDGTGRNGTGTATGTCTPRRDGTGAKLGKGAGQHRGMQGWKTTAS
jgi:hypothetical protein